jgi:molybdopterin-guanine dinucleotide biosynthesis protein A
LTSIESSGIPIDAMKNKKAVTTVKPTNDSEKMTIAVVLRRTTVDRLREIAKHDDRSLSSMVQVLLAQALETRTEI